MKLNKYSLGVGDRFSNQAEAQLKAIMLAKEKNVLITPVWNKSYREHQLIGSTPAATRRQADLAVKNLSWNDGYFVDADHISLKNVDFFMDSCDFFTLDVAEAIGAKPAARSDIEAFVDKYSRYTGALSLEDLDKTVQVTPALIRRIAEKYLAAARQAGEIYRHIRKSKAGGSYIIEVSMDETDLPQTPVELFFILAALSDQQIPVRTLAPKFSGRFNKGVDYAGDLKQFQNEFEQDISILKTAIREFNLPADLKLSVHSGSDKFSLYPLINKNLKKHDAGIHLKTAGTTWLEELIGLAEGGPAGLDLAQEIYSRSLERYGELCAPYATVINIDKSKLPAAREVQNWDEQTFASALRHDPKHKNFNPHFRQLLHVGYKIAAEKGEQYLKSLREYRTVIAGNVTANLFERHIKPLFLE